MSKKLTRKQIKERDEKAALYQRLWDLAVGANGGYEPEDGESGIGVWSTLDCESMGRFMKSVEFSFGIGSSTPKDEEGNQNWGLRTAVSAMHLENWESVESLTEFLYGLGARA